MRARYCRPAAEFQLKSVSRCGPHLKYKNPTERDTCPAPPPKPPKDDRLFWGALTMLVLAGGFAFYAKQSPEVRDWLTLHAPWFDDFIAIAYEENMTYKEFAEQCVDDLKKYINDYSEDRKPKQCSLDGDIKPVEAAPPPPPKDEGSDEKPKCEVLPPPVITKGICEIEECIKDLGEAVINNYITAKDACNYYNTLVEDTMVNFCMTKLKEIHGAKAERLDLVQQSSDNICDATTKMDELSRYLECGVQAPKEHINAVRGLITDLRDKISAARMQYQWENDKSVALDAQVDKVEELVTKYTDENQTLFSGLRYDHKKPVLQGDPDLLLYHTFRYATKLQVELCEASAGMTERINRGLETLPQTEKDLKNRNYAIQAEYKKRKYELDREYRKRADDQRANNDKTLKDALKKQLERHEEQLQIKLAQKEKETTIKLNKMVAEKVAAEKKIFANQLAEMAAKLKIVEDKLNARLKAERETRRSQQLWEAGASLLAATKKGDKVIRVDKELKAIENASGDDDKLVKTVLKAIPESVRTNGIVPESVLRERYHRMEKAALRVALVEQDGGPLPIYFLSWLQSMMLFMKLSCIPQAEQDKLPQEPFQGLDTFDLLRRARFWIERGNLAAALRYVSSLEGASRLAASTWFDAARSHLETRQAAEAVLAHAAALGLQYI
ncbi:MICOS complex subunit Mic60-like [Ostrinia nubilalis]|uniref:MICOS complex subunit Mic60-like n=1 Tax=Ostrinia nubilalis TaxID=29057 RepID=UPI00308238C4